MRTYHTNTLTKAGSALIVVDIQDKLLHAIHDWETVLANSIKMISFAQTLNVPVIVTEQYPKGLGPTNAAVKETLSSFSPLVKTVFSCFGAPGFQEILD